MRLFDCHFFSVEGRFFVNLPQGYANFFSLFLEITTIYLLRSFASSFPTCVHFSSEYTLSHVNPFAKKATQPPRIPTPPPTRPSKRVPQSPPNRESAPAKQLKRSQNSPRSKAKSSNREISPLADRNDPDLTADLEAAMDFEDSNPAPPGSSGVKGPLDFMLGQASHKAEQASHSKKEENSLEASGESSKRFKGPLDFAMEKQEQMPEVKVPTGAASKALKLARVNGKMVANVYMLDIHEESVRNPGLRFFGGSVLTLFNHYTFANFFTGCYPLHALLPWVFKRFPSYVFLN